MRQGARPRTSVVGDQGGLPGGGGITPELGRPAKAKPGCGEEGQAQGLRVEVTSEPALRGKSLGQCGPVPTSPCPPLGLRFPTCRMKGGDQRSLSF